MILSKSTCTTEFYYMNGSGAWGGIEVPSFSSTFSGAETACEQALRIVKITNQPTIDPKDEGWVVSHP